MQRTSPCEYICQRFDGVCRIVSVDIFCKLPFSNSVVRLTAEETLHRGSTRHDPDYGPEPLRGGGRVFTPFWASESPHRSKDRSKTIAQAQHEFMFSSRRLYHLPANLLALVSLPVAPGGSRALFACSLVPGRAWGTWERGDLNGACPSRVTSI